MRWCLLCPLFTSIMRQLSGSVAVPGSSDFETIDVELLHKTLLGRDQLTVAKARGAQSQRENSYKDAGTLLHLQTLINRSNVPKKPSKNVNIAEDFIQVSLITYPWLVALLLWSCCQCVTNSVR